MVNNGSTYRTQVQWASGLNLLAAIWLFISAFAISTQNPMTTNNIIFGIIVAVLAAIRLGGAFDQAWLSWLNVLCGIWVIISPWAVMGTGPTGPTQSIIICNCITGGVIVVLGLWSALATNTAPDLMPPAGGARPSYGR